MKATSFGWGNESLPHPPPDLCLAQSIFEWHWSSESGLQLLYKSFLRWTQETSWSGLLKITYLLRKQESVMCIKQIPWSIARIGGRYYRSLKEQPLLQLRVVREINICCGFNSQQARCRTEWRQEWPSLLLTVIMLLTPTTNEGHFSKNNSGNLDMITRRKIWYNQRPKLNLVRQTVRDNSG